MKEAACSFSINAGSIRSYVRIFSLSLSGTEKILDLVQVLSVSQLSLCPLPLLVSVTPHQDHVDNYKLLWWFQPELSPFYYLLTLFTLPIS